MRTKHTSLLDWLKQADEEAIQRTGTTRAYLRQIAYGNKEASPLVAANLERETRQAVTRQALRPMDWAQIWPELDKPDATEDRRTPADPESRRGRRETDLSAKEASDLLQCAERVAGTLQRIANA